MTIPYYYLFLNALLFVSNVLLLFFSLLTWNRVRHWSLMSLSFSFCLLIPVNLFNLFVQMIKLNLFASQDIAKAAAKEGIGFVMIFEPLGIILFSLSLAIFLSRTMKMAYAKNL